MPGPIPQSGTIVIFFSFAFWLYLSCFITLPVWPPKSTIDVELSIATFVSIKLYLYGTELKNTSICFNFETGPLKGTIEAIDGEITIGRSADNDLVIDDQTISGKHCKVTFENGQYFLTDLESTNGTSVNGEKISKIALSAGQTVELGKVKINVQ